MKHAKKTTEVIVPEPEQTIRLSETSGIMRRMLGFEASGLRWKGEQAIVRGRAIGHVFCKAPE